MKYLVFSCILLSCALMQACGSNSGGGSPGSTTAGAAGRPAHTLDGPVNTPTMANSVDPQGHCTPQFISDYDDLVLNNQLLKNSASAKESSTYAGSLSKSCDKFFSHHLPSVICSAHVTYNGAVMVGPIQASTVKPFCDQVKQIPQAPTTNQTVKAKKVGPKQVTRPSPALTSLQGPELTFEVLDSNLFVKSSAGTEKYLQGGKLVGGKDLSLQSTFCKVIETSSAPPQGTQFSGQKIQKNPDSDLKMNHLLILANSSSAGKVSFLCVSGSSADITVKDLRTALGPVVKVSLKGP